MHFRWKWFYTVPAKACLYGVIVSILPCICVSACFEVYRDSRTAKKFKKKDKARREAIVIPPRPQLRPRSLSLPLIIDKEDPNKQETCWQSGSPLFAKLPTELRIQIYQYIFGTRRGVVHLGVMMKRLAQMRCSEHNEEVFGWQHRCWGLTWSDGLHYGRREDDPPDTNMLAILLACRRTYSEAVNLLYSANTFNIRQTSCIGHLAATILPSRLNSIRSLHIDTIYHGNQRPSFVGFLSDDLNNSLQNYALWHDAWNTIATMQGLREVTVILSTFADPEVEDDEAAFTLTPLKQVKHVKEFEVHLAWTITDELKLLLGDTPFKLREREREDYTDRLLVWPPHLVAGSFVPCY